MAGTRERLTPLDGAAAARRCAARLLHERRRRFERADRHREARAWLRRARLHHREHRARYEERDMVELAVRELGVRHTAMPIPGHDGLPARPARAGAPSRRAGLHDHLLRAMDADGEAVEAAGYRIAVSGTGADELFSGYYDHHLAYLRGMAEPSGAARLAVAGRWREHIAPIVRNPFLQDPGLFRRRPGVPRSHLSRRRSFRRLI